MKIQLSRNLWYNQYNKDKEEVDSNILLARQPKKNKDGNVEKKDGKPVYEKLTHNVDNSTARSWIAQGVAVEVK